MGNNEDARKGEEKEAIKMSFRRGTKGIWDESCSGLQTVLETRGDWTNLGEAKSLPRLQHRRGRCAKERCRGGLRVLLGPKETALHHGTALDTHEGTQGEGI